MSKKEGERFKFLKSDHIGAPGAEEDVEFLKNCFLETGDLSILQNVNDHRRILLGRAGSGKTALISKLNWECPEQIINIEPESLALTYISNSTILKFFYEIGVNLEPFFKLLWRHIFTIEILSKYSNYDNEQLPITDWLMRIFGTDDKRYKKIKESINYIKKWGESFWENTEFRVKEITQYVEKNLGSRLVTRKSHLHPSL